MSFAALTGAYLIDPDGRSVPAWSYVRNALKDGLRYQQQHPEDGVNPFQLGFVGSLDNHNGTPTATEVDYSSSAAATTCPRRCSSAPGRRRSGTCHEDGTAAP